MLSPSKKIYIAHNVVFDEQTFHFFMGFSIIPTFGSYKKSMSTTQTPNLTVILPQLNKPRPSIVKKSNLNIEKNSTTTTCKNQFTSCTTNGNSSEPTQTLTIDASKN